MDHVTPLLMSREEFFRWAEQQVSGKYERVAGEVVSLSPERWRHNRLKGAIFHALEDAVSRPNLQVGIDGLAVRRGGRRLHPGRGRQTVQPSRWKT